MAAHGRGRCGEGQPPSRCSVRAPSFVTRAAANHCMMRAGGGRARDREPHQPLPAAANPSSERARVEEDPRKTSKRCRPRGVAGARPKRHRAYATWRRQPRRAGGAGAPANHGRAPAVVGGRGTLTRSAGSGRGAGPRRGQALTDSVQTARQTGRRNVSCVAGGRDGGGLNSALSCARCHATRGSDMRAISGTQGVFDSDTFHEADILAGSPAKNSHLCSRIKGSATRDGRREHLRRQPREDPCATRLTDDCRITAGQYSLHTPNRYFPLSFSDNRQLLVYFAVRMTYSR